MSQETAATRFTDPLHRNNITRFIDPYSDWGFKHIFGKVPNRNFLIGFLNELLKGRKVIIGIEYGNIEHKGLRKNDRKTVFDLYCTGDKGENFIVEMQKAKVENFKDRSIFYTTNLIHAKGNDVIADWDYLLPEIYFIAIMNFKFDDSHPDHFIHDVRMMEINTNVEFYPKLSYIFIEMPKFKKIEAELDNELEEWLYILNNLKKLSEIPLSLKGKGVYEKIFEIAEVANLTPEEMNEYQQSLKIQRDNNSAMRMARAESRDEGRIEERAKAEEEKLEMARQMLADGADIKKIAKYTKLSIEEIEAL